MRDPFARVLPAARARIAQARAAIPLQYTSFCDWLGVELSEVQHLVCSVAYDGADIPDTDLARRIFGRTGPVSPSARGVVAAVCGGRGGKSYCLGALRLLHGMLTRDLSPLAPGQRAIALVIAPKDKLRQEVINYVRGAAASKPELRALMLSDPDEATAEVVIRRPDGHVVVCEGGVATHGGYGGRGRALTDGLLDECAFFKDSSYRVNDEEIYKAAAPRVLPGGQMLLTSTPWAESGLLYSMFTANYGKHLDAIAFRASTTDLNPSEWARTIVERERMRDPDNARREFDAQFMSGSTTVFFDAALIEAAIDPSLPEVRTPLPREQVRAGADFGFRSDSSALAVVHLVGDRIVVGELLELRPEPGRPLVPSETVSTFRRRLEAHGASYVTADGHYREAIIEHLGAIGFADAPTTPAEAYVRTRTLLREGRVRIPRHDRLIRQLREVEARPLSGGGLSIYSPRWRTGGHGDLASAFVLAVSQFGGEAIPEPPPDPGTAAWEAREKEKRRLAAISQREGRYVHAPWKRR